MVSLFGLVVLGVITAVVVAHQRDSRRRLQLHAYMADTGWWPISEPPPQQVDTAWRSRRTKLAAVKNIDGGPVWMVWHRWTESSGENSSTHDLTRYFRWLGPNYPDVEVKKRTSVGALIKPVRGPGTGDAAFDKAFRVISPYPADAARLLGPHLRQLMTEHRLPPWRIERGLLIIQMDLAVRIETLQPMADQVVELARRLG